MARHSTHNSLSDALGADGERSATQWYESSFRFYRKCGLAVQRTLPDGAFVIVPEICGVKIRGHDANDLARNFEDHLSRCHPPNFRRVDGKCVCKCTWLMETGKICGKDIQCPQMQELRPCYSLAQHVGKAITHFGFWVTWCECHGRPFASRDAKDRHERNAAG